MLAFKFGGMLRAIPSPTSFLISLVWSFHFLYTLRTICNSSLGVWEIHTHFVHIFFKKKNCIFLLLLRIWLIWNCDLNFIGELRMLNIWSYDKDSRSCCLPLASKHSLVSIQIATSTLVHSLWGMTCEPDCVCFQCFGWSSVICGMDTVTPEEF